MEHLDSVRAENRRRLVLVLTITASFTVVEIVAGMLIGSLAVLADAAHMVSDNVAIAVALLALWFAQRPRTPAHSFGYQRAEVLAALLNGLTLAAVSLWIFYEAFSRLGDPPAVPGGWLLVIAAVGLAANLVSAAILERGAHDNLNVRGALRHVLADALGSVGVLAAGLILITTGWRYADLAAGALIGVLVLWSSWGLIRESVHILLEGTPRGIDAKALQDRLEGMPGVVDVHDLHVWTITSGFPALSAHVLVASGEDGHLRRRELERLLAEEYGIRHTTLQVDHVRPAGHVVSISRSGT
ncbi:MAG TPA: cation diffusion facilitator family transporter [Gaiellaceae bacterium]|nr:cation diffusion facilitator family transporter [Gaiellaceae bacterium]